MANYGGFPFAEYLQTLQAAQRAKQQSPMQGIGQAIESGVKTYYGTKQAVGEADLKNRALRSENFKTILSMGKYPVVNGQFSKEIADKLLNGDDPSSIQGLDWVDMPKPAETKDIYSQTDSGLNKIGTVPKGSQVLASPMVKPDKPLYYTDPRTQKTYDSSGQEVTQIPANAERINIAVDPQDRKMAAESAGKLALIQQGISDIDNVLMPNLFKDGQLDKNITLAMNAPGGGYGDKGKLAYSAIYNAIEGKLRAETGAAAQDAEIKRIANRFMPKWGVAGFADSTETAMNKINRLKDFLYNASITIDPKGKYTWQTTNINANQPTMAQPAQALPQGLSEEDIQFNMNKYGVSREQVIQKFTGRR